MLRRVGGGRAVGAAAVARLVTLPVTALSTLAATSLIIGYAGPSAYAGVAVAATIPQLLPYADLGVGAGVVNAATESSKSARHALSVAARIVAISSVLLVCLALLGMTAFSWGQLLGLDQLGISGLDFAVGFSILVFAIAMPLSLGLRVLVGLSRNATAILISALAPVMSLSLTAILIVVDAPIWSLALPPTVGLVVSNIVGMIIAARAIGFGPHDLLSGLDGARDIISQGAAFTVATIFLSFMLPFGRLILADGGSTADLASYSLVLQLYLPAASVVTAAGLALWPYFAKQRDSTLSLRRGVTRMLLIFGFASVCASLMFALVGPIVSGFISHGEIEAAPSAFFAAAVLLIVQSLQTVFGMVLTTRPGLWFQAKWSIPMGLSAAIITIASAQILGAAAPFVGAATGMALFAVLPAAFRVRQLVRRAE